MNLHPKTIIRRWLAFFMIALLFSGISAIPVEQELQFLVNKFPFEGSIKGWLEQMLVAVQVTGKNYPHLFYGYDWLAFAHIVIAILFIGPYRNPVKNIWVVDFGMIACILIIPFAFIAGMYRDIPLWWTMIDCSFGIFGLIPLAICRRAIKKLELEEKEEALKQQYYYSIA